VENCYSCREDASKCDECTTGFGLSKDGTCVACSGSEDGGVLSCDAAGKATDCYSGWFLKDGACVKCAEHCSECKDDKTCNSCECKRRLMTFNGGEGRVREGGQGREDVQQL
jgi:hypothetical protein